MLLLLQHLYNTTTTPIPQPTFFFPGFDCSPYPKVMEVVNTVGEIPEIKAFVALGPTR